MDVILEPLSAELEKSNADDPPPLAPLARAPSSVVQVSVCLSLLPFGKRRRSKTVTVTETQSWLWFDFHCLLRGSLREEEGNETETVTETRHGFGFTSVFFSVSEREGVVRLKL